MSSKFSAQAIQLAQQTQEKYGVPASVTLAQYALESGYGSSTLATKANNYFGITGSYNNKYYMKNGRKWRKYSSMEESFDDHGRLLASGRYAAATAGVTSAGAYVDAIAEIYAPSSDGNHGYSESLKQIIQDHNLTQYDTSMGSVSSGGSFSVDPLGVKDKVNSILETVIRAVCYIFLVVVAVVLVLNAFEIKPAKLAVNAAVGRLFESD